MTTCPQCGTENSEEAKNCRQCRVNLYWAFQHYHELATLRQQVNLPTSPQSAPFLLTTSKRVDTGPTANWLSATIKKFGRKAAGKKVSTTAD